MSDGRDQYTDVAWVLEGVRVIDPASGLDKVGRWCVAGGVWRELAGGEAPPVGARVADAKGQWVVPGLVDLQVHFREPGFEYKETIASGAAAAFAGGVTSVVVMPNTRPSLDTPERVRFEIETGLAEGLNLMVAAAATRDLRGTDVTDAAALKAAGAVALTDDGLPVMDDGVMAAVLRGCREQDLVFMQHAEDLRLSKVDGVHGAMTAGPTATRLGVVAQDPNAEGQMVERDIALVRELGARYHVLHTSTARSVRAIKDAKAAGQPVSCEASPHHLLLADTDCASGDTHFKMNPPLRSTEDRAALVAALLDGTVDAVATDHAPHSQEEKALPFAEAPFGVVGLETAFSALLTFFHRGELSAARTVALMTIGPASVLRRPDLGRLSFASADARAPGSHTGTPWVLLDPNAPFTVSPADLRGRSKNSPFIGHTFRGRILHTWSQGATRFRLSAAV